MWPPVLLPRRSCAAWLSYPAALTWRLWGSRWRSGYRVGRRPLKACADGEVSVKRKISVANNSFVSYVSIMSKGSAKMKAQGNQFPEEVRDQTAEALRRLRAADLNHPVDVFVNGTGNEPITLHPVV